MTPSSHVGLKDLFWGGGGGGIVEDHESLESSPRDGQLRLREGEVSKLRIRVAEREGVLAGFSAGGGLVSPMRVSTGECTIL